jgi:hypothetical protein
MMEDRENTICKSRNAWSYLELGKRPETQPLS